MFSRIQIITFLTCLSVGIAPQFLLAVSPKQGRDLISKFRGYQSPVVHNTEDANGRNAHGGAAMLYYNKARSDVEQRDYAKAHVNYGLALQYASPKYISGIAANYALFLMEIDDFHKAETILKQGLSKSPGDEEMTAYLARCLVLQDKMMEGLRHFRSIYSESEAKEAVANIYREQGNDEMLVAISQKWGGSATPNTKREPVHMASGAQNGSPSSGETNWREDTRPLSMSVQSPPPPIAVARNSISRDNASGDKTTGVNVPQNVAVRSPQRTVEEKSGDNVSEVASEVAVTPPVRQSVSKSEFYDLRVPIPMVYSVSQPMLVRTSSTAVQRTLHASSVSAAPAVPDTVVPAPLPVIAVAPKLPSPSSPPALVAESKPAVAQPKTSSAVTRRAVLDNPVKLATSPLLAPLSERTLSEKALSERTLPERTPIQPATPPRPRRHYVVNADLSGHLEEDVPIRAVNATLLME